MICLSLRSFPRRGTDAIFGDAYCLMPIGLQPLSIHATHLFHVRVPILSVMAPGFHGFWSRT